MSLTQDIKNRWLAGETINATDLSKELKCSSSVVTMAKKAMEQEGYVFEGIERKTKYKGRQKTFIDYKLAGATPKPVESNGNGNSSASALPVFPTLGATVTITLLAIDDHGTIRVGFRDGKRTWLCEVRSTTP